MPANDGIRPNDGERLAGLRKQLADPTQNHPVDGPKRHPTGLPSSQHDDLLPQHEDLGFQRRARSEQIDDNPDNYSAEIQHPAEDHPILRLTPTGRNLRQGHGSLSIGMLQKIDTTRRYIATITGGAHRVSQIAARNEFLGRDRDPERGTPAGNARQLPSTSIVQSDFRMMFSEATVSSR
jgi:hypothetical protein